VWLLCLPDVSQARANEPAAAPVRLRRDVAIWSGWPGRCVWPSERPDDDGAESEAAGHGLQRRVGPAARLVEQARLQWRSRQIDRLIGRAAG
jgi:hypothetical protein